MKKFEIYADPGANLFLAVLENGECIRFLEYWADCSDFGDLKKMLDELAIDEDEYQAWDGDMVYRLWAEGEEDVTEASLYHLYAEEGLGSLIIDSNDDGSYNYYDEDLWTGPIAYAMGIENNPT